MFTLVVSTGGALSLWLGFVNDNQDSGGPRWLQAHSWLTRSMRDKQVWSQLKVKSGFDGLVWWFLLLHLLSLRVTMQTFSKKETTELVVRHPTSRFSATVNHRQRLIWQVPRDFSSTICIASLVPLGRNGCQKTCGTIWSLAGDDFQSWRRFLLSIAQTSVTWPRCRWSLLFKNFSIGDEVTPVEVKDGAAVALVEPLKESEAVTISDLWL